MDTLLRNFDRISFWLGFLAATLFWVLVSRLRPVLARMFTTMRQNSQTARQAHSTTDEIRLGNDTLRYSQRLHLASPLFSLDEIVVTPRVLAPPVPPMAYEPPASEDITDWAMPHLSDWPELASHYGAPTLTLIEALQGGVNLVVTGQAGSGKTVALAHLAVQIIRKEMDLGVVADAIPVLLHVADLPLPAPEDPLTSVITGLSAYATSIPTKRFDTVIHNLFKQGHILFILDGLDELTPAGIEQACQFLERLSLAYPKIRVVTAADPHQLGRLQQLGFEVLTLAAWGAAQRALLITRWSDLWHRHIASGKEKEADPLLVIGWLLVNTEFLTPFELVMKVWAAFAGDALGSAPLAAVEAYLRRMVAGKSAKNRSGFEQLAAQMVLNQQPVADRKNVENWLGGSEPLPAEKPPEEGHKGKSTRPVKARGALPDLLDAGLLVPRTNDRVSVVHPLLAGYLAAQSLATLGGDNQVAAQPAWTGRNHTLGYLALFTSQVGWIEPLLKDETEDPCFTDLLTAGRWLRGAPEGQAWVPIVMRRLVGVLQQDIQPLTLKARALSALVLSGNSGVLTLLRQIVGAPRSDLRQLAALGLGYLRDTKPINELARLLADSNPGVSRAAILALVSIGDKHGLEVVASLLVSGDESQRRAAAEALANHVDEGYPTLEEASTMDDPAVRRAAVFGLARTRQSWAIKILENLRANDSQWIVQDAANQVLQSMEGNNPRVPRSLPDLPHTAWLLSFASQLGMAVAPGKPAYELLYRSLREGNEDQKLAALYYLSGRGDESAVLPLYQIYYSSHGEIRENTWEALNHTAASGIKLPSPTQYGLK